MCNCGKRVSAAPAVPPIQQAQRQSQLSAPTQQQGYAPLRTQVPADDRHFSMVVENGLPNVCCEIRMNGEAPSPYNGFDLVRYRIEWVVQNRIDQSIILRNPETPHKICIPLSEARGSRVVAYIYDNATGRGIKSVIEQLNV